MISLLKNINVSSKLISHILIWSIIFLIPYIYTSEYNESFGSKSDDRIYIYLDTATKVFWVILFYLNTSKLIPVFIYTKKYYSFLIVQSLLFAGIMVIHSFLFEWMIPVRNFNLLRSLPHNIIPFFFTVIGSIAYRAVTDKTREEALKSEVQREQLKTELSFLRSQISPHFIFNVLNNMVAMARMKSEDLEPTIIKLSDLLKYMLYHSDDDKVMLGTEFEYLQSYIDLQKQRFGNRLKLEISFSIDEDWHNIEPMLLIPFIENAFKHGSGQIHNPVIELNLRSNRNELDFMVRNKFNQEEKGKDNTSGIGLANVQRRLHLLYPDSHKLTINKTKEYFTVHLKLILQ